MNQEYQRLLQFMFRFLDANGLGVLKNLLEEELEDEGLIDTPKVCANETCNKRFIGIDRRSDAIYCSRSCARTKANREWRRRQKEAP